MTRAITSGVLVFETGQAKDIVEALQQTTFNPPIYVSCKTCHKSGYFYSSSIHLTEPHYYCPGMYMKIPVYALKAIEKFYPINRKETAMPLDTNKTFFVVSAMQADSSPLEKLNRYPTQKEAEERAAQVLEMRSKQGKPYMDFFVLKVVAKVSTKAAPISVKRFK